MKISADFVTNSSSASFVILKRNLSDIQIQMIHDHIEIGMIIASDQDDEIYLDRWQIDENPTEIIGHTSMDNFDMSWFLYAIGIDEEYIDYVSNG